MEAAIASSCAMMGVAELKEKHKDAIKSFVEGNDVLVILPTGYGKSLCFALCLTTCVEKRIRRYLCIAANVPDDGTKNAIGGFQQSLSVNYRLILRLA